MHRSRLAIGLAVLFACSFAACEGKSGAAEDTGAPPAREPQPNDSAAPPVDPVVDRNIVSTPFFLVEITPISPTPHEVVWRKIEVRAKEASHETERIELSNLHAGVLGHGSDSDSYYQIVDGRLESIDSVSAYDGVLGVWPDDAWTIAKRYDHKLVSTRALNLRDGKDWVQQFHAGEGQVGHVFRKSTRAQGGLLMTKDGVTERLAGSGPPPVVGSHHGELVDFIEARAGKVYVISKTDRTFHVVVDCADAACVEQKSRSLPVAGFWSFERHVTRDAESVSMIAKLSGREFVLDVGPAGWALGEFPAGNFTTGMWASEDGGLWVSAGDVLWHRDPQGTWRSVALPEGVTGITVAVTADLKELWLTGNTSYTASAVFATPAIAHEPR